MIQIRNMEEREAERVLALWQQMCVEGGSSALPEPAAQQVLTNLRQYASHQVAHCFVAEEQGMIIGFVTCCVMAHPVMPGLSGEIEELYVQPHARRQEIRAALVRQAVNFMQVQGAASVHVRICVGPKECTTGEELRAFWQSQGWENDMGIFSIYSNVPGDPHLRRIWDEYHASTQQTLQ